MKNNLLPTGSLLPTGKVPQVGLEPVTNGYIYQ